MGSTVGYAPGVYDLFHVGHLNALRRAREQCDVLVAGVVADEVCEAVKGIRPFVPLAERLDIVASIGFVAGSTMSAWRAVGFHRVFKGDDWRDTPQGLLLEQRLAAVDVEVVYFPYTVHTSSTALRRAIDLAAGPLVDRVAS